MRRFAENVKVRELWSVTDKTELNNGNLQYRLACTACDFTIDEIDEDYMYKEKIHSKIHQSNGRFNTFLTFAYRNTVHSKCLEGKP